MTLRQLLYDLNPYEQIRIGSLSGYFFCGIVDDFFGVNQKIHQFYVNDCERRIKRLSNIRRNSPRRKNEENYFRDKENLKNLKMKLPSIKIPLFEREVLNTYKSISDDSTIIIIEGFEQGRFNDKGDYDEQSYINGTVNKRP